MADKTQTNTLTPWPVSACEKPWLGWFSDLAEMIRQYDRLQFLALATCQAGCRLATDISPRFALVFRESYPAGLQSPTKGPQSFVNSRQNEDNLARKTEISS